MFTVKHISPRGGETLIEAHGDVTFHPYDGQNSVPPSEAHVYVPLASGEISPLYEGTVYVMNRFGTTVAKYDLGEAATAAKSALNGGIFGGVVGVNTGARAA